MATFISPLLLTARPTTQSLPHSLASSRRALTRDACAPRLRPATAVLHADPPPSRSSRTSSTKGTSSKPKPKPGEPAHRFFEYAPEQVKAVRIRHILVDTEELCNELEKQVISKRLALSSLAPSLSQCPSAQSRGGDLGWWQTNDLVPNEFPTALVDDAVLSAACEARLNVLTRVQSLHGWHLLQVEDVRHHLQTVHRGSPQRLNHLQESSRQASQREVAAPVKGTYAMQTLGCQMNRSDSERMSAVLDRMGYSAIEDPFLAEVVVLNTCNIREHAEMKVYSYLGRHVSRKQRYPRDVTLAVAGCVAQQEGERMLRRVPELDLVFGPQYANRLDELLEDVKRNGCQVAATDPTPITEDISKPRRESTVTGWVNVLYGCGENCTFCTVGNVVRSVEQSRTMEAIRKEVESAAGSGVREVVLLGQNIDAYGRDMVPRRTFGELLRYVHDVEGIERIRFTTSHPRYISESLMRTCAELEKVMPYFHIPPQHGDDEVLRAMRRGYGRGGFVKVVERIRAHVEDAAICGDMIVGFPGESEEQFERALSLIREVGFDGMNTAAYSKRPQTPAATFEGQIEEEVKKERLLRMNEVVKETALKRSERYLGRVEEVLVEEGNDRVVGQVFGRTKTNRPVYFDGDIEELRGLLVDVRIVEALPFSLKGERVEGVAPR